MSETDLVSTDTAAPRKRGGLTGMVLAELRQLAGELKIPGTAGMRKGDLIAAIRAAQGGAPDPKPAGTRPAAGKPVATQLTLSDDSPSPVATAPTRARRGGPAADPAGNGATAADSVAAAPSTESAPSEGAAAADSAPAPTRRRRAASRPAGSPDTRPAVNGVAPTTDGSGSTDPAAALDTPRADSAPAVERGPVGGRTDSGATSSTATPEATAASAGAPSTEPEVGGRRSRQRRRGEPFDGPAESGTGEANGDERQRRPRGDGRDEVNRRDEGRGDTRGTRNDGRDSRDNRNDGRGDTRVDSRGDTRNDSRGDNRIDNRNDLRGRDDSDDDDGDGRGRRGRRFRDRRRGRDRNDRTGGGQSDRGIDTEVRDGDVLLPVAGIIDVLDNYAFVRTTGYLSGPTDVYVSLSIVRKYGLRRGDAITGAVREVREGEQTRQKFNPLVRVDSINGQDPEASRDRPEFTKLTPLYPNERLRLETEPHKLTTRVIDLVMPVGKGQRALIVSPPKAGKTMIMQAIANAITTNNPECHLMVVLVDERPEEVTDMQRSVKGEVIASTFDRPPTDHTTVAELSIERAKRLVEMGHDVVVLLDNITRLGRAYNLAAPASGRILSGGVDSTALYPPKRFLGAARNIEDGGSLTIFATALVETGSTMDTVIFEEFKGTGNAELKLDRKIADKRIYPAIDVGDSSTRKDELLMSAEEYAVMVKLRRVLSGLDDQQAIDLLLTQLRKTRTNIEFLMQVAKSTPGSDND